MMITTLILMRGMGLGMCSANFATEGSLTKREGNQQDDY